MAQGKISTLVSDKNFGFISRDGEEKDLFFHKNALEGVDFESLSEGDEVTFEIEETPKGLSAISVNRA